MADAPEVVTLKRTPLYDAHRRLGRNRCGEIHIHLIREQSQVCAISQRLGQIHIDTQDLFHALLELGRVSGTEEDTRFTRL